MKIQPVIIQDSREQTPLTFANLPVEVAGLDCGDYSVKGLTHLVTCERKSLPDLLGCIGKDRDRFRRELQRMRGYQYRLLIVETDAATIESGDWRSSLTPAHAMGSLAAWCVQYSLPVWLAGSHEAAGRFVERYLYQAARAVLTDREAAAAFVAACPAELQEVSP